MKPLNLIALLLFLAGAVWALTRSERTVREIQRSYFSAISPFLKSGSVIETHTRNFLTEVRHSKELEAELSAIRGEIGRLPIIESRCRELEQENAQLRHALEFKKSTHFNVTAARIIRREPTTWWQTLEINVGTQQGLGPQLAVLSSEGRLVGIVDRTWENRSSVILLTDEVCQVSAKVEDSQEVGILSGQRGQFEGVPLLRLKFLSKNAVLLPGQRVFSTGRGGIFKANILLGTIESIERAAEDSEALVRPSVNFADLDTVFVVFDKDPPLAVTRYTIITVFLVLASFVVQQFLPAFTALHHSRILLVQLVFLCTAVTVGQPAMLLLAFVCGILWDTQSTLGPHGGDPEIYSQPVESLRFGYSILLFGGMGLLMQGIQPLFKQGKWYLSAMLSGIAIFLYLAAEYLIINFVRGNFVLAKATVMQMSYTALLTMLFSPLVFWMLFGIATFCGHSINPEAGKKKRRRQF